MSVQSNRFKIVLVGDAKVGKTTFINRHLTGNFQKDYVPTLGVDVHTIVLNSNYGNVIFDIWDIGQQGLFDAYCSGSNASILLFDVQNRESYNNLQKWNSAIKRVTGDIPLIVCGNKVDLKDREVVPRQITFHRKNNAMYYDISAKSNYNYEKPFLHLARQLTGHPDLEFVA
jgi:GTP-binding nuclear protein Ran